MVENGKPYITRTAVLTVAQLARLGYLSTDVKLYRWGDQVEQEAAWTVEDEFPIAPDSYRGRANTQAINTTAIPDGDHLLIFTDGSLPLRDLKTLEAWRSAQPDGSVRIVKVGADANPRLSGAHVFDAEEILLAVDGLETARW
jgi:hypothetical protein